MSLKKLDTYCQILSSCAIKTATLLELRQTIPRLAFLTPRPSSMAAWAHQAKAVLATLSEKDLKATNTHRRASSMAARR